MISALLDPETATVDSDGGEDCELHHYYCCDPDVAMCGEDISDAVDEGVGTFDCHDVCPLCVLMLDAKIPCFVPTCRFRG